MRARLFRSGGRHRPAARDNRDALPAVCPRADTTSAPSIDCSGMHVHERKDEVFARQGGSNESCQ